MRFNILTLFPEYFSSPLSAALLGKAAGSGIVEFSFYNPRDMAGDRHKSVDDSPYGGGPGMVMTPGPLAASLRSVKEPGRILLLSPGGRKLDHKMALELAEEQNLTLICGRYEGLDARLREIFDLEEVSVGDVVLNGGEAAALVLIEAVSRFLPGFMGKEESGRDESFADGLLEYPHFTRPVEFEGHAAPEILRSGNHKAIRQWRRQKSLALTLRTRKDLLDKAGLDHEDASFLASLPRIRPGRNLFIALLHHPVILEYKKVGSSSLTNLDIHDIARSSCTYGLGGFYVATPLEDQKKILDNILGHWLHGPGAGHADRKRALSLVRGARDLAEVLEDISLKTGVKPFIVGSTARWPDKRLAAAAPLCAPADVARTLEDGPALLLLGTGQGLAPEVLRGCDALLRPLRFIDEYNHLSVRAAAAIMLDRILGDFN